MTLEQKLKAELADLTGKTLSAYAYELWGNSREGYEVNDLWRIIKTDDFEVLLESARGRWEVFKINYSPRATVNGLSFDGDDFTVYIESDGIPFLEIRVTE
jgi:hypothetical protein